MCRGTANVLLSECYTDDSKSTRPEYKVSQLGDSIILYCHIFLIYNFSLMQLTSDDVAINSTCKLNVYLTNFWYRITFLNVCSS